MESMEVLVPMPVVLCVRPLCGVSLCDMEPRSDSGEWVQEVTELSEMEVKPAGYGGMGVGVLVAE